MSKSAGNFKTLEDIL